MSSLFSSTSHDWIGTFAAALLLEIPTLPEGIAVHYALGEYESEATAQLDPLLHAIEFARKHSRELSAECAAARTTQA